MRASLSTSRRSTSPSAWLERGGTSSSTSSTRFLTTSPMLRGCRSRRSGGAGPAPSASTRRCRRALLAVRRRGERHGALAGQHPPSSADVLGRRSEPNIALFHYGDLCGGLVGQLRRLAAVLSIKVSDERAEELARAATFSAMKGRATQLGPNSDQGFWRERGAGPLCSKVSAGGSASAPPVRAAAAPRPTKTNTAKTTATRHRRRLVRREGDGDRACCVLGLRVLLVGGARLPPDTSPGRSPDPDRRPLHLRRRHRPLGWHQRHTRPLGRPCAPRRPADPQVLNTGRGLGVVESVCEGASSEEQQQRDPGAPPLGITRQRRRRPGRGAEPGEATSAG